MQPEDRNPLHSTAVAVALGLEPPFTLIQEALVQERELGDFVFRYFAGENDLDADLPTQLVEETVKKVDPAFSLSSPASERIAMSLLEDECLVLLGGKGTPKRLFRAMRQVDRSYARPSWVGAYFRSIYGLPDAKAVATPGFVDELSKLAERLGALRRNS